MVEMSCEEHDQLAASTQFITHTVGRTLGAMQVRQGLGGGPDSLGCVAVRGPELLAGLLLATSCDTLPACTAASYAHGVPSALPAPPPQLQATPIDTKGFQSLLSLVDLTANDSFELYYGLFMYNQVGSRAGLCTCGTAK